MRVNRQICTHTQSSSIFLRTLDNRILDNIHKVSMFKIIKDMKEEIKTLRNKFGKKEQEGSNQNHIKILDRNITLIKIYNSRVISLENSSEETSQKEAQRDNS